MRRNIIAAVAMAALLIASPIAGTASAAPGLNFDSEKSPNPYFVEDTLTVAEHDRDEMSSPTEYYDDNGSVATLPATVNQSQDTPVGVRFDKVNADAYKLFPRVSGESGNAINWTTASNWTTDTNAAVADADADNVDKVEVDITSAGGNATYAEGVDITSDADKRVLLFVGNVDSLGASAEVQVRAVDSDGDYRYANISSSDNANASYSIANGTGNGFVFQEKLNNLPMAGSGDSSMGEIVRLEIVGVGDTATVTVAGLDVERKSEIDFAEIERDTDDDGDLEETTFSDYYEGGVAKTTGLDSLGESFDSAVIKDLEVYDVEYQLADLTDSDEYSTEFSSADAYNYPQKLELYADMEVPSAIDLTHGTLELEFEQGLVESRYAVAEVAEDVDSTEDFGNYTDEDSTYASVTDTLGSVGDKATFDASVSPDQNYRVHMVVLLQDEEVDTIQSSGIGGPTDTSGGGFFSTIWGQITGVVGGVLGLVGLRRVVGGGS